MTHSNSFVGRIASANVVIIAPRDESLPQCLPEMVIASRNLTRDAIRNCSGTGWYDCDYRFWCLRAFALITRSDDESLPQ